MLVDRLDRVRHQWVMYIAAHRLIPLCGAFVLALSFASPATAQHIDKNQITTLSDLLKRACTQPYVDVTRLRDSQPDARVIEHDIAAMDGQPGRATTLFQLADGRQIELTMLFPGGRLRRANVSSFNPLPELNISGDEKCDVREIRERTYSTSGKPVTIRVFDGAGTNLLDEIPLNPPVPDAEDPGGVTVGIIDSGINYTVSPFDRQLARDANGTLIGRDYWEDDDRPYDVDTARSPFFPLHHGSAVASVIIKEAPMARIVPVRYPRPDMSKMRDAIHWLAAKGVTIVNLAMGSNSKQEWDAFTTAAAQHPQILFLISAGNNGRDISQNPVYPAASSLANGIVITSSELNGALAQGSNWGPQHVDIMVPGERVDVIDHRGAPGKASGSSFAVPRVTALAVRMLAKNPDWRGPSLRDAILKRARALSGPPLTKYGWIPDPSDGP